MPRIRQGVPARMPKHVDVHRGEVEAGSRTNAFNQPIDGVRCKRAATFRRKDEAAIRDLPAQLAQRSDFVATKRVNARLAVLDAPDVQRDRPAELDLRAFQIADF